MKLSDFKQDFSSSAFRVIDGTRRIVGKFCEIEPLEDVIWDIWLVRPDREPISSQKLTYLLRGIEAMPEYLLAGSPRIIRLDGEAFLQTNSKELILRVAFYAGVKRKRRISQATRLRNCELLARIRHEKESAAG